MSPLTPIPPTAATEKHGRPAKRARSPSSSEPDSSPLAKRLRRPVSARQPPASVARPAPPPSARSPSPPLARQTRGAARRGRAVSTRLSRPAPSSGDQEESSLPLRHGRARRNIIASSSPSPVRAASSHLPEPEEDEDLPEVDIEDSQDDNSSPARPLATTSHSRAPPAPLRTPSMSSLSGSEFGLAPSPAPSSHPPTPPPRRGRPPKRLQEDMDSDSNVKPAAKKVGKKKKTKKYESYADLREDIPDIYPNFTDKKGRRICGQCNALGRMRDGKCVERWGPSTLGRGSVCQNCRKKNVKILREMQ
ncbi:hypothetical protein K523DRAFT_241441 [Schizophyllum commune Tattone D]|nr:hypothetical protein K523DRAFT_241441 [Schizophyllum commune Tattone D]